MSQEQKPPKPTRADQIARTYAETRVPLNTRAFARALLCAPLFARRLGTIRNERRR